MSTRRHAVLGLAIGVALAAASAPPAGAENIGGIEFPDGARSFADAVVSYSPGQWRPTAAHSRAENALDVPDWAGVKHCPTADACAFVSLGRGGTLTVRFDDNVLTGSGDSGNDLWIFEVGPDMEDMFVEVSEDGLTWHSVGSTTGGTGGVDIDRYGFDQTVRLVYVRLTDDPAEGGHLGDTRGADIDAVGAISSRTAATDTPTTNPTPSTEPPTPSETATSSPTATPTPSPTPSPTRTSVPTAPSSPADVCDVVHRLVPPGVVAAAIGNPGRVEGWGKLCNPNVRPSPNNVARSLLSLRNPAAPFNTHYNGLVFKCGCP